jgi:hypothetical protein
MSITNAGTGPALVVTQTGPEPVASFYDDSNIALIIADGGMVGIGKSTPGYTLDVNGPINAFGYCNLLVDEVNNTSVHKAPTANALKVVYGYKLYLLVIQHHMHPTLP